MRMINWLSEAMRTKNDAFRLVQMESVPVIFNPTGPISFKKTISLSYIVMLGAALTCFAISSPAESPAAVSEKSRNTVAAGLGYQDSDTSSITVKTYDAESGEVLSSETYELDINEEGPAVSRPRSRIFAGGVGVGVDGLSQFTLRVYDALTGRFLWEGSLNLSVGIDPDVAAYPVVAHVRPRASLARVSSRTRTSGQPFFVLRAVNPQSGELVWTDQFTADTTTVNAECISRSVIGMTGIIPHEIDFRIKMPDKAGLQVLWEDKVVPSLDEEVAVPERSDDARMLPLWPYGQASL